MIVLLLDLNLRYKFVTNKLKHLLGQTLLIKNLVVLVPKSDINAKYLNLFVPFYGIMQVHFFWWPLIQLVPPVHKIRNNILNKAPTYVPQFLASLAVPKTPIYPKVLQRRPVAVCPAFVASTAPARRLIVS